MDNMKNFYVWNSETKGNTCTLTPVKGFKKTVRLKRGISLADEFPNDVYFEMDSDFPKDVGLADNLYSIGSLIVISIKLKEFLESKKLKNVEYLPVSIINHKGKVASKDYFIINPIIPQNCLDKEKSDATVKPNDPTQIICVEQLVIDPECLDSEVSLFRLENFWSPVLIRAKLAEDISAAGFTGIFWEDPLEYTG